MHFFEDDVQRLASFAFALCVGLIPIASARECSRQFQCKHKAARSGGRR